jgi:hypothetical protein
VIRRREAARVAVLRHHPGMAHGTNDLRPLR